MERRGDYQRGVFAFDDRGAFDYVSGAQGFVGVDWRGAKIIFWGPEYWACAFAGCCWAGAFERELRQLDFFCGDDRFEDEAFDEYAAFGIYYEGAEGFAEFFVEGVADGADVFCRVHCEERGGGGGSAVVCAAQQTLF